MRKSSSLAVVIGVGSLLTAASLGRAATTTTTLFDSGGFEPSAGYATGFLTGQPTTATAANRWSSLVSNNGTSFPTAFVSAYAPPSATNTQYVQLSDSGLASTDYGYYFPSTNNPSYGGTPFTPSAAVGQQIAIRWTMAISTAVASTNSPFFGIAAFAGNTPIATAGINGTTGALSGSATTSSFVATAGTFYQYELLLDYSTQKYTIFEAPAVVGSSFTQVGSGAFLSAVTQFTDADIASYGLAGTNGVSGVAQFDNYSVQTLAVPEPVTLSTLGTGLLLLAGRRKSRSTVDASASVR